MAAIVTTTDTPEAVKAALGDKGNVRVHDDVGVDVTAPAVKEGTGVVSTDDDATNSAASGSTDESSADSATAGGEEGKSGDTKEGKDDAVEGKADKRIKALTKTISELQASIEALKTPKKDDKAAAQPTEPKPDAEPKAEDYETNADYLKALAKWATKEARKETKAEDEKAAAATKQREVVDNWKKQVEDAKKKYADWDDVMGDTVVGNIAARMLIESPDGAELSYYIGKNLDEAKVLANLKSEREVAMAIGELRAKVKAATKPKEGTATKEATSGTATGAQNTKPKPITPVRGGSTGNGAEKKPNQMTYQEYKAYRNKQAAEKRKAQGGA